MPDTVTFTVETTGSAGVRFATVAEARAFARFLNQRGAECEIHVSTQTPDGEVRYPLGEDRLRTVLAIPLA